MKVQDVIKVLEDFAPLSLQESYDNAGLAVGNKSSEVKAVLCTIDVTIEVLEEALNIGANLIISHHPIIFGNLKALTGKTATEIIIIKAIQNDIAIYAAHTNLDNIEQGVNKIISEKLKLKNTRILQPVKGLLYKLVTFVPLDHAQKVREALFDAGAGHIGKYDNCSFNISGEGTFRGDSSTNPFVGEKGSLHTENEVRIETVVPKTQLHKVIHTLLEAHPYEEVAYDIYPLENTFNKVGAGMIGELPQKISHGKFLELLRKTFDIPVIRYAGKQKESYQKVALCGGSGSFLIGKAIQENAEVFLTGDIKYHQFFEAENKLLFCDIGHYESEQFTKEIFYSLLTKKFSTFAVHLSRIVTNPIKYFL